MKTLYSIIIITFLFTFVSSSKAQEDHTDQNQENIENQQKASKPTPGQGAALKISEKKLPNGNYQYRFTIFNTSKSLSFTGPFINDSDAAKRKKNVIWNWGLITGDKKLASSLTCPSKNDFEHQYYHAYDEKGVLRCKRWVETEKLKTVPKEGKIEGTREIIDIVTPDFASKFILKSEGYNRPDGLTVGFVWFASRDKWVGLGESLDGFGFTLKHRLDKKKVKFWTFYSTEFENNNIEFVSSGK